MKKLLTLLVSGLLILGGMPKIKAQEAPFGLDIHNIYTTLDSYEIHTTVFNTTDKNQTIEVKSSNNYIMLDKDLTKTDFGHYSIDNGILSFFIDENIDETTQSIHIEIAEIQNGS